MSEVSIIDVSKSFGSLKAINRLNITVEDGEFLSLLGPSGCGKTTLLRLIAGLVIPDSGRILIGGQQVEHIPTYERNLAMVFQNYSLFPHMTVFDNVNFGLKIRGLALDEARKRVGKALEMVRLPGYETRYPNQLSGGQQQRVALARAIVYEPDVLLLDEPFGALDRKLREEMQIELKTLQRELGVTTIFVTHDQEEALTISHRIAVIWNGHLEQLDTPEGIYERPASSFVSDFIGITNLLRGQMIEMDKRRIFKTEQGLYIPWVNVPQDGRHAKISIRPEKIELTPAKPEDGQPVIVGRVTERIYLGAITRYHINFESGDKLIVVLSAQQGKKLEIEQGELAGVRWLSEDVVLLND
jgi:spermidine/putrescine ABC transporter ATP-binding subunit